MWCLVRPKSMAGALHQTAWRWHGPMWVYRPSKVSSGTMRATLAANRVQDGAWRSMDG